MSQQPEDGEFVMPGWGRPPSAASKVDLNAQLFSMGEPMDRGGWSSSEMRAPPRPAVKSTRYRPASALTRGQQYIMEGGRSDPRRTVVAPTSTGHRAEQVWARSRQRTQRPASALLGPRLHNLGSHSSKPLRNSSNGKGGGSRPATRASSAQPRRQFTAPLRAKHVNYRRADDVASYLSNRSALSRHIPLQQAFVEAPDTTKTRYGNMTRRAQSAKSRGTSVESQENAGIMHGFNTNVLGSEIESTVGVPFDTVNVTRGVPVSREELPGHRKRTKRPGSAAPSKTIRHVMTDDAPAADSAGYDHSYWPQGAAKATMFGQRASSTSKQRRRRPASGFVRRGPGSFRERIEAYVGRHTAQQTSQPAYERFAERTLGINSSGEVVRGPGTADDARKLVDHIEKATSTAQTTTKASTSTSKPASRPSSAHPSLSTGWRAGAEEKTAADTTLPTNADGSTVGADAAIGSTEESSHTTNLMDIPDFFQSASGAFTPARPTTRPSTAIASRRRTLMEAGMVNIADAGQLAARPGPDDVPVKKSSGKSSRNVRPRSAVVQQMRDPSSLHSQMLAASDIHPFVRATSGDEQYTKSFQKSMGQRVRVSSGGRTRTQPLATATRPASAGFAPLPTHPPVSRRPPHPSQAPPLPPTGRPTGLPAAARAVHTRPFSAFTRTSGPVNETGPVRATRPDSALPVRGEQNVPSAGQTMGSEERKVSTSQSTSLVPYTKAGTQQDTHAHARKTDADGDDSALHLHISPHAWLELDDVPDEKLAYQAFLHLHPEECAALPRVEEGLIADKIPTLGYGGGGKGLFMVNLRAKRQCREHMTALRDISSNNNTRLLQAPLSNSSDEQQPEHPHTPPSPPKMTAKQSTAAVGEARRFVDGWSVNAAFVRANLGYFAEVTVSSQLTFHMIAASYLNRHVHQSPSLYLDHMLAQVLAVTRHNHSPLIPNPFRTRATAWIMWQVFKSAGLQLLAPHAHVTDHHALLGITVRTERSDQQRIQAVSGVGGSTLCAHNSGDGDATPPAEPTNNREKQRRKGPPSSSNGGLFNYHQTRRRKDALRLKRQLASMRRYQRKQQLTATELRVQHALLLDRVRQDHSAVERQDRDRQRVHGRDACRLVRLTHMLLRVFTEGIFQGGHPFRPQSRWYTEYREEDPSRQERVHEAQQRAEAHAHALVPPDGRVSIPYFLLTKYLFENNHQLNDDTRQVSDRLVKANRSITRMHLRLSDKLKSACFRAWRSYVQSLSQRRKVIRFINRQRSSARSLKLIFKAWRFHVTRSKIRRKFNAQVERYKGQMRRVVFEMQLQLAESDTLHEQLDTLLSGLDRISLHYKSMSPVDVFTPHLSSHFFERLRGEVDMLHSGIPFTNLNKLIRVAQDWGGGAHGEGIRLIPRIHAVDSWGQTASTTQQDTRGRFVFGDAVTTGVSAETDKLWSELFNLFGDRLSTIGHDVQHLDRLDAEEKERLLRDEIANILEKNKTDSAEEEGKEEKESKTAAGGEMGSFHNQHQDLVLRLKQTMALEDSSEVEEFQQLLALPCSALLKLYVNAHIHNMVESGITPRDSALPSQTSPNTRPETGLDELVNAPVGEPTSHPALGVQRKKPQTVWVIRNFTTDLVDLRRYAALLRALLPTWKGRLDDANALSYSMPDRSVILLNLLRDAVQFHIPVSSSLLFHCYHLVQMALVKKERIAMFEAHNSLDTPEGKSQGMNDDLEFEDHDGLSEILKDSAQWSRAELAHETSGSTLTGHRKAQELAVQEGNGQVVLLAAKAPNARPPVAFSLDTSVCRLMSVEEIARVHACICSLVFLRFPQAPSNNTLQSDHARHAEKVNSLYPKIAEFEAEWNRLACLPNPPQAVLRMFFGKLRAFAWLVHILLRRMRRRNFYVERLVKKMWRFWQDSSRRSVISVVSEKADFTVTRGFSIVPFGRLFDILATSRGKSSEPDRSSKSRALQEDSQYTPTSEYNALMYHLSQNFTVLYQIFAFYASMSHTNTSLNRVNFTELLEFARDIKVLQDEGGTAKRQGSTGFVAGVRRVSKAVLHLCFKRATLTLEQIERARPTRLTNADESIEVYKIQQMNDQEDHPHNKLLEDRSSSRIADILSAPAPSSTKKRSRLFGKRRKKGKSRKKAGRAASGKQDSDGLQEGNRWVSLAGFMETIVRLAFRLYTHMPGDRPGFRLVRFLRYHVLPHAQRTKTDEFRNRMSHGRVEHVFKKHKTWLQLTFEHYARKDNAPSSTSASTESLRTLSAKEFLTFTQEVGLVRIPGKSFGRRAAAVSRGAREPSRMNSARAVSERSESDNNFAVAIGAAQDPNNNNTTSQEPHILRDDDHLTYSHVMADAGLAAGQESKETRTPLPEVSGAGEDSGTARRALLEARRENQTADEGLDGESKQGSWTGHGRAAVVFDSKERSIPLKVVASMFRKVLRMTPQAEDATSDEAKRTRARSKPKRKLAGRDGEEEQPDTEAIGETVRRATQDAVEMDGSGLEMEFAQFLDALGGLSVYLHPDPYLPLSNKLDFLCRRVYEKIRGLPFMRAFHQQLQMNQDDV